MKKNLFIIGLLTPIKMIAVAPLTQLPFAQPAPKQITAQEIDAFNKQEFKKSFDLAAQEVKLLRTQLHQFTKALDAYSNKSVKYQQNYQNLVPVINSMEKIRQKPFIIEVTKLLQYKLAASKEMIQTADGLISNVITLIQHIQAMVEKTVKIAWRDTDYSNLPATYKDKNMADIFQKEIVDKFPFKVKKIIRAHTNWQRL